MFLVFYSGTYRLLSRITSNCYNALIFKQKPIKFFFRNPKHTFCDLTADSEKKLIPLESPKSILAHLRIKPKANLKKFADLFFPHYVTLPR
jgi:hypothetical protein